MKICESTLYCGLSVRVPVGVRKQPCVRNNVQETRKLSTAQMRDYFNSRAFVWAVSAPPLPALRCPPPPRLPQEHFPAPGLPLLAFTQADSHLTGSIIEPLRSAPRDVSSLSVFLYQHLQNPNISLLVQMAC